MAAKDSISETVRNHKKRARWTEEEVCQALSELGAKLDQEYTGSIVQKHWVVFSNGSRKYVVIRSVFAGDTTGKRDLIRYNTSIVNDRLSNIGAILAEDFKVSTHQKHLVTFASGITKNVILNEVLCGNCTGKRNNIGRHTSESVNKALSKFNAILLEDFKGSAKQKHKVKFACGHIQDVMLDNTMRGAGCFRCAKGGFDRDKPALLYFLEVPFQGLSVYKVGITNRTVAERYAQESVVYRVLKLFYTPVGKNAFNAEKAILNNFCELKYHGESPFKFIATREIFNEDISEYQVFLNILEHSGLTKVDYLTALANICPKSKKL